MKATLITYNASELSRNEASKLSKNIIGYKDKSNRARYTYKRKGLVTSQKHLLIAKSAFIVAKKESKKIINYIKNKGATIHSWNIEISKKILKN